MAQLTVATSNAQHYVKMLCTTTTKPPSTSKFYVDFKIIFSKIKKLKHTFYRQMFCALSGRSLGWNTPVFSRFTSREHANLIGCHFFHTHGLPLHSKAQPLKNCGKRSFLGVAKSWKVTLDLVPWFWNHVENLGDVIIYPVLVVARTGSRLLSSASGHGTVAKRTVGKGRDFFLLPIFPRAILPRTFSFVTCR